MSIEFPGPTVFPPKGVLLFIDGDFAKVKEGENLDSNLGEAISLLASDGDLRLELGFFFNEL